jgi:hypothetical protein
MSENLSNLHKILKDGTRVRILEILENKTSLSYSDLLSQSGITNTGRLNYHLKVLGDLISKDGETGLYSLSEKGRLANEFLQKLNATSNGKESSFQSLKIPKTPFGRGARVFQLVLTLEVLLVLLVNLYAFFTLPTIIPLHYEFDGQILSSAPKFVFLIFAVLFNIPQTVFLLLSNARNSLASSPFSTINFPSFHLRLPKINYERRGYWVNRYFAPILAFGVVVGATMIALSLGIYMSALLAGFLSPVFIVGTVVVIAAAVVALIIYMRNYARELKADSG